jgi:hypothetical protein
MSRAYIALLLASGLWAQSPGDPFDKAPPDVDQALRDRIARFYQAHVDKKFRLADQYVAEDTKDFYYQANKPAYQAFQIEKITYSDNFTKAKAIVNCKMRVMLPGFADNPMMVPIPSTWKVEDGQWYWYVDQKLGRETPFGRMKPPQDSPSEGSMPSLASAPSIEAIWKSVQADKNTVQLSARAASSDQVTISSKMPGNISLQLDVPKAAGFKVALDRAELKTGEEAKITFSSETRENAGAKVAEVHVLVQPTNQVIPITVTIK